MKAPVADFDTNAVTLQYLGNHRSLGREPASPDWQKEQAFYRRRIDSLTRTMGKNTYPSKETEHAYHIYASTLMNHFKVCDRADVLQKPYTGVQSNPEQGSGRHVPVERSTTSHRTDLSLAKPDRKAGTLDGYVVSTTAAKTETLPQIKKVNIKTIDYKFKGITKRVCKDSTGSSLKN